MSTPLRVLLVQDSPADAKLMLAEVPEAGFALNAAAEASA